MTKGPVTRSVVDALLSAAMFAAPDGKVQEQFTSMTNKMQDDGCTYREVSIALSLSIADGLQHGNWPSADNG